MDDAIRTLYALPLDEFVAARDELAKRLRAGGDAEAARTVKALRRPSVAAWTVNQLARQRENDVARLVESGRRLREVQSKGARADELREASRERRDLIRELTAAAASVLVEGGHAAAQQTLGKVARTLDAASSVAVHAEELVAGRLVRELEPAGFGGLETAEIAEREQPEPEPEAPPPGDEQERRRRAESLAKDAERAEREASRLEEAAERAEREADDLERRASQARARAEEARANAVDAQNAAAGARSRAADEARA